jgi:hypothetical protein
MKKQEMQVMVIGADNHGEWPKDTFCAFQDYGMDSQFIYTNTVLKGMDSSTSIEERASLEKIKNFFRLHAMPIFNVIKAVRRSMSERDFLKKLLSFHEPGKSMLVFFVWTPPSVRLLKKLKGRKGIRLVLWQGEPPVRNAKWMPSFPYFEHIFCVDEEWFDLFGEGAKEKISFLPLSSNPKKNFPLEKDDAVNPEFAPDIAFVGSYGVERAETLSSLKDDNLKIYGYWWEPGMNQFPWLKEKYYGPVSNEEANKIFNNAKIPIGILPVLDPYGFVITQRVFDIALTGNFQVSGYTPAIPKMFGEAIPMFRNKEELKKLVDYYLPRPEERKRLGAEVHTIAMKGHTYESRIRTILEVLEIEE